jgi:hypothetical protein
MPRALLSFLLLAIPAAATELRIAFPALERLLAEQLFTAEGRRYFRGSPQQKCDFAYLENPKLSGQGGRLVIRARFTGRSAVGVFGRCVGMGDAFDVTIHGTPFFDRGALAFKDVVVNTNRDSFYIRRVKQAMAESLRRELKYDVARDAKKILEPPATPGKYATELKEFKVPGVRVDSDAVVLQIDFVLSVK